ncbi:hypothetical protein WA158_001311 [Blastocystis sp. Blastoise]
MASKNTMTDKALISKATSSDDIPAPGYVLKELVNSTMEGVNKCKSIADALVVRLKRSEPNVKLKTLKTIKYLIINGRSEFQKEMGTQANLIKTCLQFQGPPDPLKGDEPYTLVHNAAREVLDCLFDENVRNRAQTIGRPMEGVGANGSTMSAAPAAAAKSGMGGIGGGSRAPVAAADDWMARAKGTFGGAPVAPAAAAAPMGAIKPAAAAPMAAAPQVAKTVLGRYDTAPTSMPIAGAAPAPGGYTAPVIAPVQAGSANTDGVYERKLVEELCNAQGMKPVPPEDKLAKFCTACQTLNATVVGPIILKKLSDKNWKVVHKALCVINDVCKASGTESFKEYFRENNEELVTLCSFNQPMVKRKAGEVYAVVNSDGNENDSDDDAPAPGETLRESDMLGMAAAPAPVAAAPMAAPAPVEEDLFGFGAAPAPVAAPAPRPAPRAAPRAAPKAAAQPSVADALGDIFSNYSAPAPAPVAAPDDIFDTLGQNGTPDLSTAFADLKEDPKKKAADNFLNLYAPSAIPQKNLSADDILYGNASAPAASSGLGGIDFGMSQPQQPQQQSMGMDFGMGMMGMSQPQQQPQQPQQNNMGMGMDFGMNMMGMSQPQQQPQQPQQSNMGMGMGMNMGMSQPQQPQQNNMGMGMNMMGMSQPQQQPQQQSMNMGMGMNMGMMGMSQPQQQPQQQNNMGMGMNMNMGMMGMAPAAPAAAPAPAAPAPAQKDYFDFGF